jgi:hypothetical protein
LSRENYRNGGSGCLRRIYSSSVQRNDHGYLTANQIGGKFRQSGRLAIRRANFDLHVAPIDVTGFVERLTVTVGYVVKIKRE